MKSGRRRASALPPRDGPLATSDDAPTRCARLGCGIMSAMTSTLILLRHGESTWNALNQFTGWVDVPLSEKGTAEAIRGGVLLRESGLLPDVLHTSVLRRARRRSREQAMPAEAAADEVRPPESVGASTA